MRPLKPLALYPQPIEDFGRLMSDHPHDQSPFAWGVERGLAILHGFDDFGGYLGDRRQPRSLAFQCGGHRRVGRTRFDQHHLDGRVGKAMLQASGVARDQPLNCIIDIVR